MPILLQGYNRRRMLLGGALTSRAFTPAALFAAGEVGAWYDPSDLTTLFQDTAGTTPVTTPGQTVARINDKSGRGNHATQATAASRPTYGIVPSTGRRNLLTWTEQFDNAAWVKQGGLVAANAEGFYDRFTPNAVTTNANIAVVTGPFVIGTNTVSVNFKAQGVQWARIRIATGTVGGNTTTGNRPASSFANFDILNGVVGLVRVGDTSSIENLGDGYYRCTYNFSCTTAGTLIAQYMALQSDSSADFPSFTWNGADALLIGRAQAEVSATATAYQRVTTQWDVTEAGVTSLSYLGFDGVDDGMATSSIDFTATDKMTVFAGVRKLSDVIPGYIAEISINSQVTDGTFALSAPRFSAQKEYGFDVRGTALNNRVNRGYVAPLTNVIFVELKTTAANVSDAVFSRINALPGSSPASAASAASTGNFGNHSLFIGCRAGTSLPFNGNIYSLIIRGAATDEATITSTETWVNQRTGAY